MCLKPLDALPIHTRSPVIGPNFLPGRLQGRECKHLVHQTKPTSSFDAVDQRQHHTLRPYASFHPIIVCVLEDFSALCSPCGHYRRCLCFRIGLRASTFLPPSLGVVLLPTLFTAKLDSRGSSTMRALNPPAPRQCERPLRSICLAVRASNPPNTLRTCTSRFLITPVRTIGSLRSQASP